LDQIAVPAWVRLLYRIDQNPRSGTITRSYDGLDRLTQEQTPQGVVNYTYDTASRREKQGSAGKTGVRVDFPARDRRPRKSITRTRAGTQTLNRPGFYSTGTADLADCIVLIVDLGQCVIVAVGQHIDESAL